jgi:hypothetical protein
MREHGIFTTKAEYIIHLHPVDARAQHGIVYWYRVAAMRAHIELTKPSVIYGFSKDPAKTMSGAGYLIAKDAFFIRSAALDRRYCAGFDWSEATTDRERGMRGEQIVAALLDHGVIQLHRQVSTCARTIADQFDGIDGWIYWYKKIRFEAKTETVQSNNLFVQAQEGNHRPQYAQGGIERLTNLLPLFKGRDQ